MGRLNSPISRRAFVRLAGYGVFGACCLALVGCGDDASVADEAEQSSHWGYRGAAGPDSWVQLSEENAVCADGQRQSPIDLSGYDEGEAAALEFHYSDVSATEIEHQHIAAHTLYAPGNALRIGEREYTLLQHHWHTESEHTLDGQRYAMELHLVHQAQDGELAVVGVLYALGEADAAIERLIEAVPPIGENAAGELGLPASDFAPPTDDGFFRYDGSLTTPPCSEGVRWSVARRTRTISERQAERLRALTNGPNFRPLQPLNGRTILLTPH